MPQVEFDLSWPTFTHIVCRQCLTAVVVDNVRLALGEWYLRCPMCVDPAAAAVAA